MKKAPSVASLSSGDDIVITDDQMASYKVQTAKTALSQALHSGWPLKNRVRSREQSLKPSVMNIGKKLSMLKN